MHASPSSTHENAEQIAKIINEQNLFPHGVMVKVIDGARGAKARTYVSKTHAGDPKSFRCWSRPRSTIRFLPARKSIAHCFAASRFW